ncbi:hypothetical protein Leryth_020785 [Lithospermum erythrorhizon]|nr:hypothetical protein Leryth_020785 [Lithospermum erythrorhizon]
MGKKSRKANGKSTCSPLPTNDLFKDLETPPVHGLNPSTSRVFDDSLLCTPRAGLGKLVEGDVRDGSAKGNDVPSVDCSTPVVDMGCCVVLRGGGYLGRGDVAPMEEPKGFCLAGYFSGRFSGLRTVHQLKDSCKVKCKVIPHELRDGLYFGLILTRIGNGFWMVRGLVVSVSIWFMGICSLFVFCQIGSLLMMLLFLRFHFGSSFLLYLKGARLSRVLGRLAL